ncbi:hypothetical protein RJT34_20602 [Clitoria ternatea]|uniref:Transmembrane protein n=1 Tax=Clitoria ternatea TaxID=43366 RepID=A0AAN9ITI3_CLITE
MESKRKSRPEERESDGGEREEKPKEGGVDVGRRLPGVLGSDGLTRRGGVGVGVCLVRTCSDGVGFASTGSARSTEGCWCRPDLLRGGTSLFLSSSFLLLLCALFLLLVLFFGLKLLMYKRRGVFFREDNGSCEEDDRSRGGSDRHRFGFGKLVGLVGSGRVGSRDS